MTMQIDLLNLTPTRKGRVRGNGPKATVARVEASDCEGVQAGPHELTNTADATTYCRWCGETYAALDESLVGAS